MKANVSSQYISALLLIASKLENGLTLHLDGKITSAPYIRMTLSLLNQIGVETSFEAQTIRVKPNLENEPKIVNVESDWSSASYFYSIIALSPIGTKVCLSTYKKNSLQGDSVLAEIYKDLGVETFFDNNKIHLRRFQIPIPKSLILNLNNSPDIAQTIAVTCFGLGIGSHLTGLHTLKIKETDRLLTLKNELEKLGATVVVTDFSLTIQSYSPPLEGCPKGGVALKPYHILSF